MSVFCSRKINVPVLGKLLSDYSEGDTVLIHENGTPVEFYVAKHDYESGLNGGGRTLLVRKNCYDSCNWHTSDVNAYETSGIDSWLNGDYKSLLDNKVQTEIAKTTFYYTIGNGNSTVTTLSRSVFLLSITELGESYSHFNVEGSALPIAGKLKIAKFNGSAVTQWTRSPRTSAKTQVGVITINGNDAMVYCTDGNYSRPCFTLPSYTKFDYDTNVIK